MTLMALSQKICFMMMSQKKSEKKETINELYDRLGLHKWWQEPIDDPNATFNNLPLEE